jgi:hypothetical protein
LRSSGVGCWGVIAKDEAVDTHTSFSSDSSEVVWWYL